MDLNWMLPEYKQGRITYSIVFISKNQSRLRITGKGRIPSDPEKQPWRKQQNYISDIWIGEGITVIEDGAFAGCNQLKRAWLPDTLRSVGKGIFADCPMLEQITVEGTPEQLKMMDIAPDAFPDDFPKVKG